MNRLFTKSEYLKLRKGCNLNFENLPFTKEACAEVLKLMRREFKPDGDGLIGYLDDNGEVVHEVVPARIGVGSE